MKVDKISFVKLAVLSAILFLIIVFFIEFLYALYNKETLDTIIANMTTKNYLLRKVVGAVVYGSIMAYFMKKKAKGLKK